MWPFFRAVEVDRLAARSVRVRGPATGADVTLVLVDRGDADDTVCTVRATTGS